jgi:hypothetical protein
LAPLQSAPFACCNSSDFSLVGFSVPRDLGVGGALVRARLPRASAAAPGPRQAGLRGGRDDRRRASRLKRATASSPGARCARGAGGQSAASRRGCRRLRRPGAARRQAPSRRGASSSRRGYRAVVVPRGDPSSTGGRRGRRTERSDAVGGRRPTDRQAHGHEHPPRRRGACARQADHDPPP